MPINMTEFGLRCVARFIDWLYDSGIDPDSMPREKLLTTYVDFLRLDRETRGMQASEGSVVNITQERAKRRRTPLSPPS
jgi:hypothetical protein